MVTNCKECGKEIISYISVIQNNTINKIEKDVCSSCKRKANPAYKYESENRLLSDGIYDVTGIPILHFNDIEWYEPEKLEEQEGVKAFMEAHPNYVVAQAYETYTIYILAGRPESIGKKVWKAGNSFNYGSGNLLTGCPDSILILAEND